MAVPASLSKWAHPPRSNTPRSSSSGPPGPCITPSTETCVVVVSFMVAVPFSLSLSSFDSPGRGADLLRRSRVRLASRRYSAGGSVATAELFVEAARFAEGDPGFGNLPVDNPVNVDLMHAHR